MRALNDNIKPILALIVILGFYAYIFTVLIMTGATDQAIIIALVGLTTGSTGYYFGNSQGAAKKDETIATMTASAVATPATTNTGDININPKPEDNGTATS